MTMSVHSCPLGLRVCLNSLYSLNSAKICKAFNQKIIVYALKHNKLHIYSHFRQGKYNIMNSIYMFWHVPSFQTLRMQKFYLPWNMYSASACMFVVATKEYVLLCSVVCGPEVARYYVFVISWIQTSLKKNYYAYILWDLCNFIFICCIIWFVIRAWDKSNYENSSLTLDSNKLMNNKINAFRTHSQNYWIY